MVKESDSFEVIVDVGRTVLVFQDLKPVEVGGLTFSEIKDSKGKSRARGNRCKAFVSLWSASVHAYFSAGGEAYKPGSYSVSS